MRVGMEIGPRGKSRTVERRTRSGCPRPCLLRVAHAEMIASVPELRNVRVGWRSQNCRRDIKVRACVRAFDPKVSCRVVEASCDSGPSDSLRLVVGAFILRAQRGRSEEGEGAVGGHIFSSRVSNRSNPRRPPIILTAIKQK